MDNLEKEIKTPKTILDINKKYITEFYQIASPEDKAWIQESIEKHMKRSGPVKYFAGFRSDFAKKFLPEIAFKKAKPTVSLLDTLRALDETDSSEGGEESN